MNIVKGSKVLKTLIYLPDLSPKSLSLISHLSLLCSSIDLQPDTVTWIGRQIQISYVSDLTFCVFCLNLIYLYYPFIYLISKYLLNGCYVLVQCMGSTMRKNDTVPAFKKFTVQQRKLYFNFCCFSFYS